MIELPPHEFDTQKGHFGFCTFLSRPEIITCLQKSRIECNKVLELSLLTTALTKSYSDGTGRPSTHSSLRPTATPRTTWLQSASSTGKPSIGMPGIGTRARAEEFTKEQTASTDMTVAYLKDTWMAAIKTILKNQLKQIGKGWFNVLETSREVYGMSKLSRFLRMLNFMMEVLFQP